MTFMRRCLMVAGLLAVVPLLPWFPAAAAEPPPKSEELVVRDAWARATPPGTGVAAVYLTVEGGTKPDTLRAATTAVATMTQIHSVTETDGVSRMRETDGVPVPARGKVVLAPGGLHLMLMGLAEPLVAGDRFDVTLEFAHAGRRVASVVVIAPDQVAPGGP
jgi:copper(I)-binding protein